MRRARGRIVVLTVALGLASACGDGMSAAESARKRQVAEIRAAAEAGDMERAREEVAELRALLEGQVADGEVDDEEAMRVIGAAEDVESALGPPPTEATTTTTTTTAPPPPPEDDKDDEDDDKGDDEKGKGRGKGGDD